jgi:uncharacterized protein (DUF305 family)
MLQIKTLYPTALVTMLAMLGFSEGARSAEPAPDPATATYEVRFMTQMIDHHMMAVMMGEMCIERAIHPELTTMCQDIVANQTAEIETMQAWLQDWYGISYEPEVNHESMTRLMSLYGEEFEITFMRTMIRHHSRAVRAATKCVETAYHPDLISMCTDIVQAQLEEIQTLRTWLCQWYGICRSQSGGIG